MVELIEKLYGSGCSCVIRNGAGETRFFYRKGVADLYGLICNDPGFLKGASIADKVVGKAAAALMIKGGISRLYSAVLSEPAEKLLAAHGVQVSCGKSVPFIENRDKSGWCPLEKLSYNENSIDAIFCRIENFLSAAKGVRT